MNAKKAKQLRRIADMLIQSRPDADISGTATYREDTNRRRWLRPEAEAIQNPMEDKPEGAKPEARQLSCGTIRLDKDCKKFIINSIKKDFK